MSELMHTEEREGFTIELRFLPEDTAIADSFDSSVNDLKELEDKVSRGVYMWFAAHVTASKAGIVLGEDYLGACMYESLEAFMQPDGYWPDMVSEAISHAKAKLAELCGSDVIPVTVARVVPRV